MTKNENNVVNFSLLYKGQQDIHSNHVYRCKVFNFCFLQYAIYIILKLLTQSTVSAPIGFISEAVDVLYTLRVISHAWFHMCTYSNPCKKSKDQSPDCLPGPCIWFGDLLVVRGINVCSRHGIFLQGPRVTFSWSSDAIYIPVLVLHQLIVIVLCNSNGKWIGVGAGCQLTLKVLVATIDAQWEGMGGVGSARYEPALLPPCPTIRVLSYSN